ncbi:MAG TPA: tRNA (N6-isopentenyl adenosine(37)-C2)-methylthiotransferase MiaB [Clostridiales bacterium]|nr:tRNA (N6-isopentenyl adenosine(37)-C2)-methylthiotransferase MiaB [Clostridiales bacterium]
MNDNLLKNNLKYFIQTFGCQMNVHESEKISGLLNSHGYSKTYDIENADIIVFNTCCIRDTAEKKILSKIGDLKALKRKNKDLIIAIVGCMTQQKGKAENILKSYNYVDIILGSNNHLDLVKYINELPKKKKIIKIESLENNNLIENFPICRDSKYKAYVNITYGCNNYCTYCIVPYVRGSEISRDPEKIISEITNLLKNGVKEITLLGQNVNSYKFENVDFNKLLSMIDNIDVVENFWIRFMTSHPKDFNSEIIETIANSKHLCKSIHLPLQSGSNKILNLMNRKYTREQYLNIIKNIKDNIPNCGITTDIMVGFPYETEKDFLDTIDILEKAKFINAFTFVYSKRNGTPASEMPQISAEIKKDRIMRLIKKQNEIAKNLSNKYINNTYTAFVESYDNKNKHFITRLEDGKQVNINSSDKSILGTFVKVKIINAGISALLGEII